MKEPLWIWMDGADSGVNQYVEFRQAFFVEQAASDAELCLSVDTNFIAYVNGQYVGSGQFSDFPEEKTFSRMDVSAVLRDGENELRIVVHYCGVDNFSYIAGQPGLWFTLQCGSDLVVSDEQVLCRPVSQYKQGEIPRITFMMGFVFEYDARRVDAEWVSAKVVSEPEKMIERPLPMLLLRQRAPSKVVGQGLLKRDASSEKTVAQLMQSDFLSSRRDSELFDSPSVPEGRWPLTVDSSLVGDADGVYMIFDLEREECGFVDLDLQTSAGTVVDVAVGEHLDDGRVRAAVDKYGFASRYTAREGRQRFTHGFNRYAGRYVEIHLTNLSGPVSVFYSGLIPFEYPLNIQGRFSAPDSRMKRIFEVSQRTLHLCMHEHYEDCPWREQALYGNDSRIQAITGYVALGEYDFPRVSFDLLAQTLGDDGYQEMCAPMKFRFTIPSFNLSWFLAIADHLRFSGDVASAKSQMPRIKKMLDAYCSTMIDDLMPSPQGVRYWHFYDWSDSPMCGRNIHPDRGGLTGVRFDAPLNFFLVLALRSAHEVASICGDNEFAEQCLRQADATTRAAHAKFWREDAGAYESFVGEQADEHFGELSQSLALLCGAPDGTKARTLRSRLMLPDSGLVPVTLSQSFYKYEALLQDPDTNFHGVFDPILKDWGYMLEQGATSFWETILGADDMKFAGSLCHGWSGLPAYFYQTYLLGIRPAEPGFSIFEVRPVFGAQFKAEGVVPTPKGPIRISWEKTGSGYAGSLSHPPGTRPVFVNQPGDCRWSVTVEKGDAAS